MYQPSMHPLGKREHELLNLAEVPRRFVHLRVEGSYLRLIDLCITQL